MAEILVAHGSLRLDGHTSVCMQILDSLHDEHDVELLVNQNDGEEIDIPQINDNFGTNVPESVLLTTPSVDIINKLNSIGHGDIVPPRAESAIGMILDSLFVKKYQNIRENYDLVIDTERGPDIGFKIRHTNIPYEEDENKWDESMEFFDTPTIHGDGVPTIYYRHNAYKITKNADLPSFFGIPPIIDRICRSNVEIHDRYDPKSLFLANSNFTSERLEKEYDLSVEVLYPPINVDKFESENRPWDQREEGFVTVGRLSPYKNQLKSIDLINKLRRDGVDVHLHIVGATDDRYNEYADEVLEKCNCDYIKYHGRVPNDELIELLCTHKYGIHATDYERFGIVIAEMVAAGMIPFVPDNGGQVEVIDNNPLLRYDPRSVDISGFSTVLGSPETQQEIRKELESSVEKFSSEAFGDSLSHFVNKLAKSEL